MTSGGCWNKILVVNLSDKSVQEETISPQIARDFIGGAGFGIKFLFDRLAQGTDPFSPDNSLIFSVGPFTGTSLPSVSRMAVTAKSPLTGAVGMAMTGGYFPNELKKTGYDALIILGKSDNPVYLSIVEGDISFRDASHLWGTHTSICQEAIKKDLNDDKARIICIGPAGENLCRIACLINERRAAGRKGLGAVMGSKNLKAIAVRGNKTVPITDVNKFNQAKKDMVAAFTKSPLLYPIQGSIGTPVGVDALIKKGIFASKNFSATGLFRPYREIGVEAQITRKVGRTHCYGCPVGCSQLKEAKTGKYKGTISDGPEFETLYSFGGQTGVNNLDSIIAADFYSDELGLDTMSAGVVIGFAMELYEKGILTIKDTDGLDLKFGSHETMVDLLFKMAGREGIGDLMADGVRVMAEKVGRNSEKYALHVKGLELPAYDVRGAKAHGLNYATAFSGADHNRGYAFQEVFDIPFPEKVDRFSIKDKGKLTKYNQDMQMVLVDCTTQCSFILPMATLETAIVNTIDILEGLTGYKYSEDQLLKVGERVNNLAKVFNVREGFSRKDDTLPERLLKEAIPGGKSKGATFSEDDLNRMLDEYYMVRGWNLSDGKPTKEKLIELGLDYTIDSIYL